MALGLLIAVAPVTRLAALIALPHLFANGEVADAVEVNENFATLEAESNAQDLRITNLEGPDYVSSWTALSAGQSVQLTHGLGVIPTRVSLQVASSANPSVVHVGGALWKNFDSEGGAARSCRT